MDTILFFFIGWLVGVLVNRAADNLPPPASASFFATPRCPFCQQPRGIEQSALLSYLLFRTHCPHCRAPLPLRSPVVEIVSGLLFAFLWQRFGATPAFLLSGIFTLFLLTILVIDVEHRLILNIVVLPATLVALALSPWQFPNLLPWRAVLLSLTGALAGWLTVLGIYWLGGFVARLLAGARGRTLGQVPFGMGDVKMAGLVGAIVGLPLIFQALFVTILLGGVGAIAVILFNLFVHRRYDAFAVMPYGPYFVIATWFFMIWQVQLLSL